MSQQINLCTPILLKQKHYFSAQTMLQALAVFLLLGGGLCAYSVWSLNRASEDFRKTLVTQASELASLQAAIAAGRESAGPVGAGMKQDLLARRVELAQREKWLEELRRGLFVPGFGHSARLQLLAQTIPAQVWMTELSADENRLDVSGLTLEPAALNDWVSRMGASPLMKAQQLSTVKVENVSAAMVKAVGAVGTVGRPVWSFTLTSALAKPVAATGGKP
jgi:hypothetical protein